MYPLQLVGHELSPVTLEDDSSYPVGVNGNEEHVPFEREPKHPPVGVKVCEEQHGRGTNHRDATKREEVICRIGGGDKYEGRVPKALRVRNGESFGSDPPGNRDRSGTEENLVKPLSKGDEEVAEGILAGMLAAVQRRSSFNGEWGRRGFSPTVRPSREATTGGCRVVPRRQHRIADCVAFHARPQRARE